jgi:hypothetical protein
MQPILASDFTGFIEIMIWFWGNVVYAGILVIGWLFLIFRKTRPNGIAMFKPLLLAGTMLLVVVALQVQPMIFYNHRNNWEEFGIFSGISLGLFLAALATWLLLRRKTNME